MALTPSAASLEEKRLAVEALRLKLATAKDLRIEAEQIASEKSEHENLDNELDRLRALLASELRTESKPLASSSSPSSIPNFTKEG